MKYSEARPGRVFVIRLTDGEIVHEVLERFAREQSIRGASLIVLGGAGAGSKLVAGPEDGSARPVVPMELVLDDVHEVAGAGTIFPNAEGVPVLHMHMACGRSGETHTGCVRRGVRVWQVLEVVLWELTDTTARRQFDPTIGFEMLEP
jgi:predicted DNA-binding protein with PD1-like motif